MKNFYFLRHGQTDWNARGIFMGSQDIALNQTGILQARRIEPFIAECHDISSVVSSPLVRAVQTSAIVNQRQQKPTCYDPLWQEANLGEYEGTPCTLSLLDMWLEGFLEDAAESAASFRTRISIGFDILMQRGGCPLIVSHGMVFRVLCDILGIVSRALIGNCTLCYFSKIPNWHMQSFSID